MDLPRIGPAAGVEPDHAVAAGLKDLVALCILPGIVRAVVEFDNRKHLQILDDDPIDAGIGNALERDPEGAAALLGVGPDECEDRNLRPDLAVGTGGEK